MKHKIVGNRHQLLALDMNAGEELFIFGGRYIFSKGDIEFHDKGGDFINAGLEGAVLLSGKGGRGLIGVAPQCGGHLKRVEIAPPSGLATAVESVFALSRGVTASVYSPPVELAEAFGGARFALFKGVGMTILRTDENFIEFTLGADEEIRANVKHIIAFSGGIKVKQALAIAGEDAVIFGGPGNLILSSG
jgi:uncharacterized protein (AIM24 family)